MADKLLILALKKKAPERAPFWFMRQAGRYLPEYREVRAKCKGFLDLCYTPERAAEVTLQPVERFGMDAAILFSDILVLPHALGADVRFVEGEGPKLKPLQNANDIAQLSLPRVEEHIQPVLETVRIVKSRLKPETALIGFAGAPWTVACYMIEGGGSKEFGNTRSFALEQKELFGQLIALLTNATVQYLKAQAEAGTEVIQLFDSWAGILPPDEFERWVMMPAKKIISALKAAHPEIPIIGFPRMAGTKYAAYARETGVDAVSIDQTADMQWCAANVPAVLQGNLDPHLLAHDLPATLAYAEKLCRFMHGKPFVFNLGHGMLPHIPIAHVQKLCEQLKAA